MIEIVAEAGINHSGDLETAIELCRAAKAAGATYIKFQKRTLPDCVPEAERGRLKETPWGLMTYLEYKERLEFGKPEYDAIDEECRRLGIRWTASAWDVPSVEFLVAYRPSFLKIPSACLTDHELLMACHQTGRRLVLSVGMSTLEQIDRAVRCLSPSNLTLMQCTSSYPALPRELNLSVIPVLRDRYGLPVGFSSHSTGVWAPLCAAVLGAVMLECHLTLDRASWGTDQAASLEPSGFANVVRYVRRWEEAKGDGIKVVYDSEKPVMAKLRRFQGGQGDV